MTLLLTDRLRGKYVLPVNDGAGPLNGLDTFTRHFNTPPIQHEAAQVIDELLAALKGMMPANVDLNNRNIPDDTILPCDVSVGELRAAQAAIATATKSQP